MAEKKQSGHEGPKPERERAKEPDARATITNEAELELARVRSMSLSERPTPTSSASILSLANAQAGRPSAEYATMITPAHGSEAQTAQSVPPAPIPLVRRIEGPPPSSNVPADPREEMRSRVALGDYTGALEVATELLAKDPDDAEARSCADHARVTLVSMYRARVSPLDRVPVVAVPKDQLRWLSLDHRAGFVLSHVDGVSTLETILDVSGMPELDAYRILADLIAKRVIAF